jgi:putative ABC transport system permease protein
MRLQALAIGLVIASGVAIFIMSLSTYDSLYDTRERYYRDHHFADVFADLKRAPLSLVQRIQAIPGVQTVQTRVISYVNLSLKDHSKPISAHLISLDNPAHASLNQLYLRQGRFIEDMASTEVMVSEEFARAHRLTMGDTLSATINGHRKTLTLVGTALSPEYIYQIAPGAMFPDYQSYGVLWMARAPLASAYDMQGAFNNVTLTLSKQANAQAVIDRLDSLLKPYGGQGAYARKDQLSNRFLSAELEQLKVMAHVFPVIFLGVATFLLNVVIRRLMTLERQQIAVLKAFGYSSWALAVHYSKLVVLMVSLGTLLGIALGAWMGHAMSQLYMDIYSLPYMHYQLKPILIVWAGFISLGAAVIGTILVVTRAAQQPPAQAMHGQTPTLYRATIIERLGLQNSLSQPTRMIFRHLERRPFKALLTVLGLSMACAIMMVGGFQEGAINKMIEVQYTLSQREDFKVLYTEPSATTSLHSIKSLQGVQQIEGFRSVMAKVEFAHRHYTTALTGLEDRADATQQNMGLFRLLDQQLNPITSKTFNPLETLQTPAISATGVIITDHLAAWLHIKPGDMLTVYVLEGKRPTLQIPVIGTIKEYLGLNVYLPRHHLNRLLREGDVISGARLKVDSEHQAQLIQTLKGWPKIVSVTEQSSAIKAFYQTMDDTILFFTFITTLLGASIAFGVIYNSLRIALSERQHELASLRVLGFYKHEVAYILLGEHALLTLLSIPLGFLIGVGLCHYLAMQFASDLYRIPLVLDAQVYAFAALVVIGSSLLSALLIWRNLSQLDMVKALKANE